jgi:ferredoxin-thioredoxin reductase catalytic subunit
MLSLDDLRKYAESQGYKLSEYAEKIYARILVRNGCCPCRTDDVMCPCPDHYEEIERTGKCHCNFFMR